MEKGFNGQVAEDWMEGRQKMMTLLQEEAELEEIVKMVGMDCTFTVRPSEDGSSKIDS